MFKRKKPGIAILEVIMVLAISGFMFVAVVGIYNTRRSSAVDDAARQVVSEIAKVRNEAQENYVVNAPQQSQFVGKYLTITGDSSDTIVVGSEYKNNSGGTENRIDRSIKLGEGLKIYLYSVSDSTSCNDISCYKPLSSNDLGKFQASNVTMSYNSGSAQQSVGSQPSEIRMFIAVPGGGGDINTQMQNAKKKYFIKMPFLGNPTIEAIK